MCFLGGTGGKELTCQSRRLNKLEFNPGLGRFPRERHGNPLQYSCLQIPMDRGAWQAAHPQGYEELGMTQHIESDPVYMTNQENLCFKSYTR